LAIFSGNVALKNLKVNPEHTRRARGVLISSSASTQSSANPSFHSQRETGHRFGATVGHCGDLNASGYGEEIF
jgi:hypothetical protein